MVEYISELEKVIEDEDVRNYTQDMEDKDLWLYNEEEGHRE